MALKSYPQICIKCSIATVEKSKPLRVSMPWASNLKSERAICLLQSSFKLARPILAVRPRLGCSLSHLKIPLVISHYGLSGGLYSPYFGRFFQTLETGFLVVGNQRSYSVKTMNKRKKWPKVHAVHENETSMLQVTSSSSEGKAELSSLDSQTVKDKDDSLVIKSTKASKGKGKVTQKSRSTKEQNQSSSGSVLTEAGDAPNSSKDKTGAKKTRNNKSKQSSILSEIDPTSGIQTKEIESNISIKNVAKKTGRNSAKKEKPKVNGYSVLKSTEKATEQNSSSLYKAESQDPKTWPQLYPPIANSVLVVESLTKAKVIQGYLGKMYEVLPTYGHVRDLAARTGSVQPDDDFSMVWEVPSSAQPHLKSIKAALRGAENLILASDPDREGEAIAWHIIEMLQQDILQEDVTIARVVFNEITESSIKSALQSPREIDADLVNAYLARRALDYLIGFNISPLLWRKLPGCQSAGRVQSAALALICDREKEIEEFKSQEYWTIDAEFKRGDPNSDETVSLSSHLTHFDSKRLTQFSISTDVEAKDIYGKISQSKFEVVGSKTSKIRRNPPTPYITSTLQQDAANKLNFSASYTMKIAQKLYEGVQLSDDKATGLITYMRTDGLQLSNEAANDIQSFVREKYGLEFAAITPRKYFKKVKNSQEAHEAIRPTDIRRLPSMLSGVLDEDSMRLYTLIWSRTMACQMEPAVIELIQCDIGNANKSIIFRSTCSRVEFPGFRAVYDDIETRRIRNEDDEDHHNGTSSALSNLKTGEPLSLSKIEPGQHYTQPPPRYSEGSLIKTLEELGIGRPSTYATTIKVLKDRKYVTTIGRTLHPEFRGRMVSAFLSQYFSEVTECSFTADMETELDNVSAGLTEWKGLLKNYWARFSKYCESASDVNIRQVEKMLEQTFSDFLFSSLPDGNRTCPSCQEGQLVFKVSRFGAGYFLGCSQHPKCKYIGKALCSEDGETDLKNNMHEPKLLGLNALTNEKVLLKKGPYGYYVQLGEDGKGRVPKRVSVSRIKDVDSITLEDALELLKYPVTLGNHPDNNQPVILKTATSGFSIQHMRRFASVPKDLKPDEITLEKALELLEGKSVRRSGRPKRKVAV